MQKMLVGAVLGLGVVGGGAYLMTSASQDDVLMKSEQAGAEEKVMMEKDDAMMKEEVVSEEKMMVDPVEVTEKYETVSNNEILKKEDDSISIDDSMMTKVGLYAPYEASKLVMANNGDVVLFFKASWCPSCRALDSNIKANLATLPADLTILEVDYDTAIDLRQQYGVTTQHTLVQVDAEGILIKKWSGGSTVASIVAQVQ